MSHEPAAPGIGDILTFKEKDYSYIKEYDDIEVIRMGTISASVS